MATVTTMFVSGDRLSTLRTLFSVPGAKELGRVPGSPLHAVKIGHAIATAFWSSNSRRLVIHVDENDRLARTAAAVFARFAADSESFEITLDATGEVQYEFLHAS